MYAFLAIAMGYLLGSIPFGLLLTKLANVGDIRAIGSGNIGATNVLRTGKKWLALATLLLDGGKGALAIILAKYFVDFNVVYWVGLAAVAGHMFPVWLKGRGGKGVATTLAVVISIAWPLGLMTCGLWLVIFAYSKYSSLASLISLLFTLTITYIFLPFWSFFAFFSMVVLVYYKHMDNIKRLVRGEELRFGKDKEDKGKKKQANKKNKKAK